MKKDILEEILAYKRDVVARKKAFLGPVSFKVKNSQLTRYRIFKNVISRPGQVNLIAEIKKASPSKGLIREQFDAKQLAKVYAQNGAVALSVLTEDKYFLGRPEYLRQVSDVVDLPLLCKDFLFDEFQVYEAFRLGASAVLLIVAILDNENLQLMLKIAGDLDLDCLVEVHDQKELDRALKAGAEIIGINNRDLRTFEVDLKITEQLVPKIPKDRVIVAESGISSHEEIKQFRAMGVHAVLIGETFLRCADVGAKVREVMEGPGR